MYLQSFKYSLLLVLLLPAAVALAQTDSLAAFLSNGSGPLTELHEQNKCGFTAAARLRLLAGTATNDPARRLQVLQRPAADTSIVSPSGRFRIHYFTSGQDKPAYSMQELAKAADSAWSFAIGYLGFLPPPPDGTAGGDNKYDIYVENIGSLYGYTEPETETAPGSRLYTSFIVIDNDFAGFYTDSIDAARVTAAHEFHHAIQIGAYALKGTADNIEDSYFYELTATSMEEFVYNSVNDYYGYMSSYFSAPYKAFSSQSGYNLAHWNIYLVKRFGYDVLLRQWQLFSSRRALFAIDQSLRQYGSSFGEAFGVFGVWNYYTGSRANPALYFTEGANYPLVRSYSTVTFRSPGSPMDISARPVSTTYMQVLNNEGGKADNLWSILVNTDIARGTDSLSAYIPITYGIYSSSRQGTVKLTDYYNAYFYAEQPGFWNTSVVLNNTVLGTGNLSEFWKSECYPSPFRYSRHTTLTLSLPKTITAGAADFAVYTLSGSRAYSTSVIISGGQKALAWQYPAADNGEKLATGVYLYVIKQGDSAIKGKLVILND